jgi:manganese-dependent inorganic pyrophosphatase
MQETGVMATPIYVIGHVNPDTDAIASAMGYAWLLRERDRIDVVAARAGPVNLQTSWVLKYLEMDPPFLLTDASSRFESVMRRFDTITPEKPLREGWAILSRTGGIAPVINEDGTPYGLLTGKSLFIFLSHLMGPRPRQQDMKISDILDVPCRQAVDVNVPRFHASHRIRDNINRVLREEGDEFWVVDDDNHYVGICRQRDLLNPPRIQVILVDHNEAHQALGSLEEADLMEILDHHRLGNPSTHIPIRFTVDVIGSTSTLVFERIVEAGLSGPPFIAGMLLAGLLSDTLILTSPTTTDRDRAAAERLAQWAFSGSGALAGETIKSYGQKIISAGAGLGSKDPRDVVSSDMKIYRLDKFQFSIAQVEVSDLYELSEHVQELNKALQELKDSRGLDFAMLMVTDVVRGTSRLLVSEAPAQLEDLPYQPLNDGTREAEGIVSRKKQLLPVILSLLEN